MSNQSPVLEYKCPCCDAALDFDAEAQQLKCSYCDNEFEIDAVRQYNETEDKTDDFQWQQKQSSQWTEDEQEHLAYFLCPSCAGQILTDENTAATFCPYCENPTILPERVTGGLKPDAVIPFKTTKESAQEAFQKLCKNKPLLPKDFASRQRVEKITGMYIPFWLYACSGKQSGRYKATRVRHWSDAHYNYRRTDHFLLTRSASAEFDGIPMDGSRKMDDSITESIEPFDYNQMVDFNTAYLSGYLADKFDVDHADGESRIRQRVGDTMDAMIQGSMIGYTTVIPVEKHLNIQNSNAKYVLLPVWMLHSKYKGNTYVFAMNGQTGKMTGTFPICPKRCAAWFAGICAGVTALVTLIQYLVL